MAERSKGTDHKSPLPATADPQPVGRGRDPVVLLSSGIGTLLPHGLQVAGGHRAGLSPALDKGPLIQFGGHRSTGRGGCQYHPSLAPPGPPCRPSRGWYTQAAGGAERRAPVRATGGRGGSGRRGRLRICWAPSSALVGSTPTARTSRRAAPGGTAARRLARRDRRRARPREGPHPAGPAAPSPPGTCPRRRGSRRCCGQLRRSGSTPPVGWRHRVWRPALRRCRGGRRWP